MPCKLHVNTWLFYTEIDTKAQIDSSFRLGCFYPKSFQEEEKIVHRKQDISD